MYLLLVPAEAIVDLKKYVARDKLDPKLFIQSDLQSRTVDGQLVSLPAQSGSVGIQVFWNKEHYREVGLDPEVAPKTSSGSGAVRPPYRTPGQFREPAGHGAHHRPGSGEERHRGALRRLALHQRRQALLERRAQGGLQY